MGTHDKKLTYKILLLVIIQIILSCNDFKRTNHTSQFYEYNMKAHDVWRLPIVYPYELITAFCCSDSWTTGEELSEFLDYDTGVDSINVVNEYLILQSNGSQYRWVVANLNTQQVTKFELSQHNEYLDFLAKQINMAEIQLLPIENIYNGWKLTGQLPWGNYIVECENRRN
jgi:hypothetical protein